MHAPVRTQREQAQGLPRAACLAAALTIALSMALGGIAVPVRAAGSAEAAFTVANYPVEAKAKDAVTAKANAMAEGQQAALRSLLRRLVPVTAYRKLKAMPPLKAADLVDGVAIREERNSTTQYIATLDFSFRSAAVREALRRQGLPFVDVQAPPTLLVPVYRPAAGGPPDGAKNIWQTAWSGLDLAHTVSPLKIEPLKPEMTADDLKQLTAGTGDAEQRLIKEYKAERVLIAIAETNPANQRMTVTLAGTDAVGTFRLQRTYRIVGNDLGYTAELAAVVALGVIEGRWKAAKGGAIGGVDVTTGAGVSVIAEFATLNEWNDIRTRLLEADGAFDVNVVSVYARTAEINVRHPEGAAGLANALARSGLTMTNSGGQWVVKPTF